MIIGKSPHEIDEVTIVVEMISVDVGVDKAATAVAFADGAVVVAVGGGSDDSGDGSCSVPLAVVAVMDVDVVDRKDGSIVVFVAFTIVVVFIIVVIIVTGDLSANSVVVF